VGAILSTIAPLYTSSLLSNPEGSVVALTHGDLTHRNILSGSQGLYFIDGERSGMAPPEFDVWLLLADSIAHSSGRGSHAEFIQQVWRTSPEETPYRASVEKLYELVPGVANNRARWTALWQSFTAHCLFHSITDCLRRGKSLDWLDGLT
jgi:thiamine kinase-like enzyme